LSTKTHRALGEAAAETQQPTAASGIAMFKAGLDDLGVTVRIETVSDGRRKVRSGAGD